jgi:hypothetical protein
LGAALSGKPALPARWSAPRPAVRHGEKNFDTILRGMSIERSGLHAVRAASGPFDGET